MSFQDEIYMVADEAEPSTRDERTGGIAVPCRRSKKTPEAARELGTSCPTLRTVGQHPYFGR